MDHDRILRLSTVLWKTGLPKSGVYRLIKQGSFPRQVPLTDRAVGWRESEVERWIADPAGYRSGSAKARPATPAPIKVPAPYPSVPVAGSAD